MTLRTQLLSLGIASCAVATCARRPGAAWTTLAPWTAGAPAAFDAGNAAQFVFPIGAPDAHRLRRVDRILHEMLVDDNAGFNVWRVTVCCAQVHSDLGPII